MERNQRHTLNNDLARLADGDRAAFRPVFDLLWPALRGYAASILANDALGEEAAQQALMKVFEQASDFDASRDGWSWAVAITTWECRTLRRRLGRRKEALDSSAWLEALPSMVASPEALAIAANLETGLADMIASLGAMDQETLRLTLAETGPPSTATFRKRRQRAMARLKAAWRSAHGLI